MSQEINHTFKTTVPSFDGREVILSFVVFYDKSDIKRYIEPHVISYEIKNDCYIPCDNDDYENFEQLLLPIIGKKQLENAKLKITQEAFEYLVSE